MDEGHSGREVLFEFHQAGPQVRVAAIDVETGIEVVAIAPTSATQTQMKNLALAKLRRRIQLTAVDSGSATRGRFA